MVIVRAGLGVATNSIEDTVSQYKATRTHAPDLERGIGGNNGVPSTSVIVIGGNSDSISED